MSEKEVTPLSIAFLSFTISLIIVGSFIAVFSWVIGNTISDTEDKIQDVNYCQQVYERPDDFRPSDGTMEEKYDYCEEFRNELGPVMISDLENIRFWMFILLLLPIIHFIYNVVSTYRETKNRRPIERTEYKPVKPKILVECSKCGKEFMKTTGMLTPCSYCGYEQ